MNEYDTRQLNVMMQKIKAFNSQKLHFLELLNDLEGLLNVLTEVDEEWKAVFRSYWWEMEQCYAFALDEEREFDNEDQIIIKDSVRNLEKMVKEKLFFNKPL